MKTESNSQKAKEFLHNPNAEIFKKYVAVHECVQFDDEDKESSIFKFSESAIDMMRLMNDSDCAQTFLLYHRQNGMTPRGEQLLEKFKEEEKEKENEQ